MDGLLLLIVTDDDDDDDDDDDNNEDEDEDEEATVSNLRTESIPKASVNDMGLWTMIPPLTASDTLKCIVGKSQTTRCFTRYSGSRILFCGNE
ncbi:hypothetical protein Q7P35_010061 [Cladosporium inversicolor]